MDHVARLQLIGRITYYIGWISLLCGGLLQLNMARSIFLSIGVSKRNLFEISVACFVICIASELRSRDSADMAMSGGMKKAA